MKRVYVDMDGVIADYNAMAHKMGYALDDASRHPGFFTKLEPIAGSIEAIKQLSKKYDVYILTAASWTNPVSFAEKIEWIKKYFPSMYKRAIFSDNKSLLQGDYLIDDRCVNMQKDFSGKWIQFGTSPYNTWDDVLSELL